MLSNIQQALTEPTDRRKVFIGWDAAKGKDPRRQIMCARLRSALNTYLRYELNCVMRHQSFWRFVNTPDEETLERVAEFLDALTLKHKEGDTKWWELAQQPKISAQLAKRLKIKVPAGVREIDNPFYGSTEKPKCHADYRIFVMGESASAEKFGIALEMETLAKWAAAITESADKAVTTSRTTKQLQNSLKRKLEGLLEIIKEYDNSPRYKEIVDELMISDDLIRQADLLLETGGD